MTDGLLGLAGCHHLGHGDAGVEGKLIRGVLGYDLLVGFVGEVAVAEGCLHLSHEKPLAGALLLAHLMLDDLAQIGDGLLILSGVDIIVGIGVVPLLFGMVVDGVAAHVANHVLGIVEPVLFDVAFGEPGACLAVDGGLGLIETAHVGESGCCLIEGTFMELRASHQHPCFPQHGIVFSAVEPLDITGSLSAALCPFGTLVDAVELDGLLTLLNGSVEIAGTELLTLFVANRIEGDNLRVIVLVAVFLLQRPVDIGECAVVVGVVPCGERLPETASRRVLL